MLGRALKCALMLVTFAAVANGRASARAAPGGGEVHSLFDGVTVDALCGAQPAAPLVTGHTYSTTAGLLALHAPPPAQPLHPSPARRSRVKIYCPQLTGTANTRWGRGSAWRGLVQAPRPAPWSEGRGARSAGLEASCSALVDSLGGYKQRLAVGEPEERPLPTTAVARDSPRLRARRRVPGG